MIRIGLNGSDLLVVWVWIVPPVILSFSPHFFPDRDDMLDALGVDSTQVGLHALVQVRALAVLSPVHGQPGGPML